jgi:predicted nucleic acid-binding protein
VAVYDASYIVLAEGYGLAPVTEERRLRSRAQGIVEVKSLRELVG